MHGRVPESERSELVGHLEGCERCQKVLEDLAAAPAAWSRGIRDIGQAQPAGGEALRRVMEKLKASAHADTGAGGEVEAEVRLDFLSPADKPGLLGRLGPYDITQVIGRGGMGIVLKAIDPGLERVVAIKVLAPTLATNAVARRRFKREAQAAAAISHDHVVTIHAVDEANGLPYLVMQYIDGMSLQDRIDRVGALELKEILRIGAQAASGLAAAHAQGLIHRDIKPANILLENGVQRVKITDFGLARAIDDASVTQSGFVAGTPQYMAPEQARGEPVDHRADLFSLGSVLYAMCTGRPPFNGTTTLSVLRRVSDDLPRPVAEINPAIPDWLVAVVARLHAKEPADRYQSAGEVAGELERYLARVQQAGWTPPPVPAPVPILAAAATPKPPLTSFTICPSCGSQLHVPEKMVGQTVSCPQCGKPFRVLDTSQELQVVHPAKPAAPVPARPKRRTAVWLLLLLGLGGLMVLCCGGGIFLVAAYTTLSAESLPPASDAISETVTVQEPPGALIGPNTAAQRVPSAAVKTRPLHEVQRLEGTWRCVALTAADLQLDGDPAKDVTLELQGDRYALTIRAAVEHGTYRLNLASTPKGLDMMPLDGIARGKVFEGIYELESDTLRIYVALPGQPRPASFPTAAGLGRLYRLQRQKY
jgi:uncharacterized protein (TIGR03067 family)